MFESERFLKDFEDNLKIRPQKLKEEFQGIRGNRPTPDLLEHIKVSAYDQQLPLAQVASLSIRPPREIVVQAWDVQLVPTILKAIEDAKLGVTASREENLIRVFIPALTEERKEQLTKLLKKNTEEVRIQIRHLRDEAIKELKTAEGEKALTEDQLFKAKERVQKIVDQVNDAVEKLLADKVTELSA